MARVLSNLLVVGARWETLIGLQKEPAEVRGLASSRGATHYAVADDGSGTRTAGLITLPIELADLSQERFALAALIAQMVDGNNIAFVHPDPEDPTAMVLVLLRERRPVKDVVVPSAQAWDALRSFVAESEGTVKVVGEGLPESGLPLPLGGKDATSNGDTAIATALLPTAGERRITVAYALTFDEIAAHARRERPVDARFRLVRKPLPTRKIVATLGVLGGLCLLGGAGWFGWDWYEQYAQEQRAIASQIDPVDAYKANLKRVLAAESFASGGAFAKTLQHTIQTLPANAGGWRPESIVCNTARCDVIWNRKEGGTFDLLLSQRPNAGIVDLDHAGEIIPLHLDDAAADSDSDERVTPVPLNQFLRSAGARLQQLGDYGMDISMSMPELLAKRPPSLAGRADLPPSIAKGEWRIAGHLAFLDSVAGLMTRAGNMSLQELKIVIDDTKPIFTAQGFYYVH